MSDYMIIFARRDEGGHIQFYSRSKGHTYYSDEATPVPSVLAQEQLMNNGWERMVVPS